MTIDLTTYADAEGRTPGQAGYNPDADTLRAYIIDCGPVRVSRRKTFLPAIKVIGIDLRGAILTGADLHGDDLRGANLTGADLRGARLNRSDLRGARLTGAILEEADL